MFWSRHIFEVAQVRNFRLIFGFVYVGALIDDWLYGMVFFVIRSVLCTEACLLDFD